MSKSSAKRFDAKRPSARQRGYTTEWEKARAAYLVEHPLCAMCEARGVYTSAKVVDHITPHKGDPVLFWDQANWQSLCTPHHNRDKQSAERGRRTPIGVDGWPIDACST